MRKFTIWHLGVFACLSVVLLSSCKNDSELAVAPAVTDQSFSEEFDTVSASFNRGWQIINASNPAGPGIWQQGGDLIPWFTPYSNNGSNAGFIGAGYLSTSGGATLINNWLVSPELTIQNGDSISFYTRAYLIEASATDSTDYANRMQVLLSTSGSSTVIGQQGPVFGATIRQAYGDFSTVLVDINPTLLEAHTDPALNDLAAYPTRWTRFVAVVSSLNKPMRGRFAFRYLIDGGGSAGAGSGVAIDKVEYKSVSRNR
jgi:hypothetical protein